MKNFTAIFSGGGERGCGTDWKSVAGLPPRVRTYIYFTQRSVCVGGRVACSVHWKGYSAHPKRSKFPRSTLRFLAMLLAAASHWPCNDGICLALFVHPDSTPIFALESWCQLWVVVVYPTMSPPSRPRPKCSLATQGNLEALIFIKDVEGILCHFWGSFHLHKSHPGSPRLIRWPCLLSIYNLPQ